MLALEGYETTSGAGNGALACDPESYWHDIIESFAGVGYKHANPGQPDVKPLTAKIQLAPSELRHASVTKHVSIGPAEMIASDCGSGGGITCQQELHLVGHGHVYQAQVQERLRAPDRRAPASGRSRLDWPAGQPALRSCSLLADPDRRTPEAWTHPKTDSTSTGW